MSDRAPEPEAPEAPEGEPDVPVDQWAPEDPEVADVGYWGGLEVPQYAEEGSPDNGRIVRRQRRLLAGHAADHSSTLGQEALAVGRAGRALDGLLEQLAASRDPGERYAIWLELVKQAQAAPAAEEPQEPEPPKAPPSPPPTPAP